MILDKETEFSSDQALTVTVIGTDSYDLSSDRSIGNGNPMGVMITVKVDAKVSVADEDYTFDIEYASNSIQTTGLQTIGRRVFQSTPAAGAQDSALLVAGFKVIIPIPATTLAESERYIGVRYTLAGTGPTITVDAEMVPLSAITATNDYPIGYVI